MSDTIKKLRRQRSMFCQKAPAAGLIWGAVFFQTEGIWVACKGRINKLGRFRYSHNGITNTVGRDFYRNYAGCSENEVQIEVKAMNLQNLEVRNPRRRQRNLTTATTNVVDFVIMPGPLPVVAAEPANTTTIQENIITQTGQTPTVTFQENLYDVFDDWGLEPDE